MLDLELATTDEIVAELAKRFDSVLLSAVATKQIGTAERMGTDSTEFWFRGSQVTAIGLASIAQRRMLDAYGERLEIIAGDDEGNDADD